MAPPFALPNVDVEVISGICGSISIACWVVVFSPQILENVRRRSAEGLSVQFLVIWLLGDVFNILGAIFQHVLPTMLILAIYYTIADIALLAQCFYYNGLTVHDELPSVAVNPRRPETGVSNENTRLLGAPPTVERDRRGSDWSAGLTYLSPTVPLDTPQTDLQGILYKLAAVLIVCAAGAAGWWLGHDGDDDKTPERNGQVLHMDVWGQIFGWLCAVLYLGSRLPQLLLNWRRKSTEGVSMMFFIFACLGNLMYILSIIAYEPKCVGLDATCHSGEARGIYGRYILLNLSWLAGSAGTLLLDLGIFIQFFVYKQELKGRRESEDDSLGIEDDSRDQRSLRERINTGISH